MRRFFSKLSSMAPPTVPSIKLNSGASIPVIGLGTWKSKPGDVTQTVKDAIDVGYRHIDCAFFYDNEKEVGVALAAKMKEGKVKRQDLFITSKLWNTFHKHDLVQPALKKSLASLGLQYVDLYLIHWPMAFKEDAGNTFPTDAKGQILHSTTDFVDTWKAMEECVKAGLTKSIGVSNFNSAQLKRILDSGKIKPAMNQIECHPYLNQSKLADFCKKQGIALTAYCPLGSGDRPWAKPTDPKLLDDPKFKEIAKKYNKTPAQIVLRWLIQRDFVAIPKTVHKDRLVENLNIFDFKLQPADITAIDGFNRPGGSGRLIDFADAKGNKNYPFSIEF